MSELKPCPFCSGKARIFSDNHGDLYVGCETDRCAGNTDGWAWTMMSENEAIDAWNRRPDHAGEAVAWGDFKKLTPDQVRNIAVVVKAGHKGQRISYSDDFITRFADSITYRLWELNCLYPSPTDASQKDAALELVKDLAENGLRFDLTPTHDLNHPEEFWHEYVRDIEQSIKDRAQEAIAESQKGVGNG